MSSLLRLANVAVTATSFLLLSSAAPLRAAGAYFQGLGDLPGAGTPYSAAYAVSNDGTAAVGFSMGGNSYESFRWTAATGIHGLGNFPGGGPTTAAYGVSDGGAVVVGSGTSPNGSEGFRWTAAGGVQGLGDLPGGAFSSNASDVTPDGSIIVGSSISGTGHEAYRWTSATGMVGLGTLAGRTGSNASGISSDGTTIVGTAGSASNGEAFRWTSATGMVGLGQLGQFGFSTIATAVNGDGSVIVGEANDNQAFRWTSSGGMVGLGYLPGGLDNSEAHDVSDDGLTVVGLGRTAAGFRAFIWTPDTGMRSLQDVLVSEYGMDLGGWILSDAWGISGDGRVITGHGMNPSGNAEAWIVVIPEPGSGVLLGVAACALLGRRRRC